MQIEILNGGEILVNCKFKLNHNLNLNLYREIQWNLRPCAFLMCAASVSERVLAEPFRARDFPKGVLATSKKESD